MDKENLSKGIRGTYRVIIIVCSLIVIIAIGSIYFFGTADTELVSIDQEKDSKEIVNGVHLKTGFVEAPGMQETITNCTSCHSSQLVIQNRMNAQNWKATIDWMQETQNLWDLGDNEAVIIDYLVKNYPPSSKGRRAGLTNVRWYELKQ